MENIQNEGTPSPSAVSSEAKMSSSPAATNAGWSWGGFMLNWVLILAARRYMYLFLLLLTLIPVVNFIFWIAFAIYMGIKGRNLIMSSQGFASPEEAKGFMKGVDHAGKILFFVMLALIIIGLIFGLVVGAGLFSVFTGLSGLSSGVPTGY